VSGPGQQHLEAARALHAQGRLREAEAHYRAAEQSAPADPTVAVSVAMFCVDAGRLEEAVFRFERIRAAWPQAGIAHLGLGNALYGLGRPAEALPAYEEACKVEPGNPANHFGKANALQVVGRLAEARKSFERAVALAPDFPPYHYPLAQLERFTVGDPRLAALERLVRNEARYPEVQTVELHFALGKAYADLGRCQEAFDRYRKGNAIRRRYSGYDEAHQLAAFAAIADAFTPEAIGRGEGGDPSDLPIFIVGMPRCGSSLVEQILASHPLVYGAGELTYLPQLIDAGLSGRNFPLNMATVDRASFRRFGQAYVAALGRLAPKSVRIVDKALSNFRFAGLIHLALPKARIIHVRRDPRDTCLSCYFHLFAGGVNFADDLGELGRYYKAYERLMAHWRAVLPPGAILDVVYEDLVDRPEVEIRRLLDYCGLDFDRRCLQFHRTERVVHTVSAVRVRQPMNRAGIGRWRPYEAFLGPLLAELESG
jgi:tetratricopeptide (TPR) repeat protein